MAEWQGKTVTLNKPRAIDVVQITGHAKTGIVKWIKICININMVDYTESKN